MEDGVDNENNNVIKMGATGNPNAARLATLQERKKTIEESLAKCNQKLRQLCIQEADLTGTVPQEMPLEPGESPPLIRRRIGTAYQLPENLIKNATNKDESASDLELQIQLHANLAEAALGLANEQHISKTLRREHMKEYQQHKKQFNELQEKLSFVKDKEQQQFGPIEQLYKQKKKPRPMEQDDNISMNAYPVEPFNDSELRHSIRSSKCSVVNDSEMEQHYSTGYKDSYKNQQIVYVDGSFTRPAETLATGVYRLSINGYKNYMERRENNNNIHMSHTTQHNLLQYTHSNHYQPVAQHSHSPNSNSSHMRSYMSVQQYNYQTLNPHYSQYQADYNKINVITNHQQGSPSQSNIHLYRQNSPSQSSKVQYYFTHKPHSPTYRYSTAGADNYHHVQNPHQIQPHQQYDHSVMAGLGGYWKKNESGEAVWCHYNTVDSGWHRDKRFGSLDRRKNKRIHKRVSPSVDNKSATLASVPSYSDHIRTASIRPPQVINRRPQDNRQLIRTQSLGSVGAQTIESVWPSDDNSSCESDNRSINSTSEGIRKHKKKEWLETSLDGPVSSLPAVISRSQSAIPSILSPEEKYISSPTQHAPPPLTPKPAFEIPAESNPSPRMSEANIEIFNNNIPKNCTVVQAGHCKPYHEETKPFEMSDFYKYSTKFKKSPAKPQQLQHQHQHQQQARTFHKNLNETFDDNAPSSAGVVFQGAKHNFTPNNHSMSPGMMDNSNSLNSSLDLSHIANANVAEHFSDEMNTWYKNRKYQVDNGGESSTSKGKSTATLV